MEPAAASQRWQFRCADESLWIQHYRKQQLDHRGGSLHEPFQSGNGNQCKPTHSLAARPISTIRSGRIIPAASTASARRKKRDVAAFRQKAAI